MDRYRKWNSSGGTSFILPKLKIWGGGRREAADGVAFYDRCCATATSPFL